MSAITLLHIHTEDKGLMFSGGRSRGGLTSYIRNGHNNKFSFLTMALPPSVVKVTERGGSQQILLVSDLSGIPPCTHICFNLNA